MKVSFSVNGKDVSGDVEPRTLLVDFLRGELGLTGTHVGCDTSQCGACVVHVNGRSLKSCTLLAVQAQDSEVTTIEGLADGDTLHPLQTNFIKHAALQCGVCTPGFLIASKALLDRNQNPTDEEIRFALAGNLCRCTGYDKIVRAVKATAKDLRKK